MFLDWDKIADNFLYFFLIVSDILGLETLNVIIRFFYFLYEIPGIMSFEVNTIMLIFIEEIDDSSVSPVFEFD